MVNIGKKVKSDRVKKGIVSIIKGRCKKCNHDRIWNKPRGKFCAKCGERYDGKT